MEDVFDTIGNCRASRLEDGKKCRKQACLRSSRMVFGSSKLRRYLDEISRFFEIIPPATFALFPRDIFDLRIWQCIAAIFADLPVEIGRSWLSAVEKQTRFWAGECEQKRLKKKKERVLDKSSSRR